MGDDGSWWINSPTVCPLVVINLKFMLYTGSWCFQKRLSLVAHICNLFHRSLFIGYIPFPVPLTRVFTHQLFTNHTISQHLAKYKLRHCGFSKVEFNIWYRNQAYMVKYILFHHDTIIASTKTLKIGGLLLLWKYPIYPHVIQIQVEFYIFL